MSTAVQADPEVRAHATPELAARIVTDGKFLRAETPGAEAADGVRFLVKGVTYGTFAPDADGYQFPALHQVAEDFRMMAGLGINTVRTYTPPRRDLLDEAARHGLRVMVGLPWSQHVAFLDDRRLARGIRQEIVRQVGELADHPAALIFALGNEIPPGVVRWHGRVRIENFLRDLYHAAKAAAPDSLLTYVNFPPTEFLDLSFFDICAFNVYLHREPELRSYLARLQHIAGHKPLLLAEAGADSVREGESGQADITAMHIRTAFEEGACGAVAFTWTDEWWRGGHPVDDWAFGLVDRDRNPKPASVAVAAAFNDAPFPPEVRQAWPRVSVVVCAYNAADTIEDCLSSLERLTYPDYEIILVNDGSKDRTGEIARSHPRVRVIDTPNRGLSAARNSGLAEASGEIVAYTDADVRVDRDWLTFLIQPFLTSDVVGSGRTQCRSRRRSADGAVHRARPRGTDARPARRPHRRARARLQHGVSPRSAPRDRRLQSDLLARRRRCGRVLAAAGTGLEDRVFGRRARLASPPVVDQGVLAAADRLRRGRDVADGPSPGEVPRRAHAVARAHLQPAALRAVACRARGSTRVSGGPRPFLPSTAPTCIRSRSCRTRSAGRSLSFVLAMAGLAVAMLGGHAWTAALLLGDRSDRHRVHHRQEPRLRHPIPGGLAARQQAVVPGGRRVSPFHSAHRAAVRGESAACFRRRRSSCRMRSPRKAVARGRRSGEAWRAILLLSGTVTEDRFWSDQWTSSERVLSRLADWLRRSRAVRTIEIDEGWSDDRDLSIPVGRWAWLDARALVEDHGGGKSMLRVSTHLRPTIFGVVSALALGLALFVAAVFGVALRWPPAGAITGGLTILIIAAALWRTAQATAILRRSIERVTVDQGMHQMPSGPARAPLLAPSLLRMYGLRSATIFVIMILSLGASTFMLREVATGPVIGGQKGYAGDYGPAIEAWLDTPGGVVVAPNGDVYIADSNNHVIRRIDARTTNIEPVAGNHNSGSGFAGDNGPATAAQLDTPERRRDRSRRGSHRRRLTQPADPSRGPADRCDYDHCRIRRERL